MKKLIALTLALCALFSLAACGKDEPAAPDGYKIASNEEICSYTLYVPETWAAQSDRTDYTIAAVSSSDKCTVSVAKIEDDALYDVTTVAEYWEKCKEKFTFLSDFAVTEEGAQISVGKDGTQGWRYTFSGKYNGADYKYMQVFFLKGRDFYCYTYTATAEHFDKHLSLVNDILSYFRFR